MRPERLYEGKLPTVSPLRADTATGDAAEDGCVQRNEAQPACSTSPAAKRTLHFRQTARLPRPVCPGARLVLLQLEKGRAQTSRKYTHQPH